MQFPIGVGIGLLGFASAATTIDQAEDVSRVASTPPREERSITDDTQIVVIEGVHRWYNLLWNDLLGIDGEWEEIETEDGTVLLPLDEQCSVAVRPLWKDEIHYLPVPRGGELRMESGWLEIDQVGRSKRAAEFVDLALARSFEGCDYRYSAGAVHQIEESGGCWEDSGSSGCATAKTCASSGGNGCSLELIVSEGMGVMAMTFEGECGAVLSYSRCVNQDGTGTVCVNSAD